MVIHLITDHSNHFSHRKSSQDCTNPKSVQMSEDNTGHQCSHCKADNIEADLDLFDTVIHFTQGDDRYYYCFKDEGFHITYHRFLPADYKDLGV